MIFFTVSCFAFTSGILVFLGGIEPRNLEKKADSEADKEGQQDSPLTGVWKGILAILNSVQRVFRIRSFQVILVVGIIETFHWVSPAHHTVSFFHYPLPVQCPGRASFIVNGSVM